MRLATHSLAPRSLTLCALICFIIHLAFVPAITLGAGHIHMALIFTGLVSLSEGGTRGIWAGFFSGLLFDIYAPGAWGMLSLLLCIAAFCLGADQRNRIRDNLLVASSLFSAACLAVVVVQLICMLAAGYVTDFIAALIYRVLSVWILTSLAFVPAAWLYRKYVAAPALEGSHARPSNAQSLSAHIASSIATTFSKKRTVAHMPHSHSKLRVSHKSRYKLRG